jgi:hypothetical protein
MWVTTLTLIVMLYVFVLLLIHFFFEVCQLLSQYFHFHAQTAKEKCTIHNKVMRDIKITRTVIRDIKNSQKANERHQQYPVQ